MDKGTVLIVDDEEAILQNLTQLFGTAYKIHTASSAEEADKVLHREHVHVIISDYKMPVQDGLSFLIDMKERFPAVIRLGRK